MKAIFTGLLQFIGVYLTDTEFGRASESHSLVVIYCDSLEARAARPTIGCDFEKFSRKSNAHHNHS